MTVQDVYQRLLARFGQDAVRAAATDAIDPWIEVRSNDIAEVAEFLKHEPTLAFDQLCDLTAVDYFEPDPKKQKGFGHEPHLEVVYHLYSFQNRHWLVVKCMLPRWKGDLEGEIPSLPTVSHVWAIANWHEREAYDLMGVDFVGHPNLLRILCPDDWVGHPLRKDYELPLEYHGIRGK